MSEEEQKALKDCDTIFICLEDMMSEESANDYRKSYKIIKNLIDKQQKEIDMEKQYAEFYEDICKKHYRDIKHYKDLYLEDEELNEYLQDKIKNSISKDKIREKIKECKDIEKDFAFINNESYARKRNKDFILLLEELLGE